MRSKRFSRFMSWVLSVLAVAATLVRGAGATNPPQMIYSFSGGPDGEYTDTDLVIDQAGNIYGTSVQGGAYGSGTVWQLSPSASGWIHTVLYDFRGGQDGGEPYKGVALDKHGNLYGTAGVGGKYVGPCSDTGCGVVFKLAHSNGAWIFRVIHSFVGGSDGYGPGSPLVVDRHGNVYGMTPTGGTNACACGVVFQLEPEAGGHWEFTVIHAFAGGNDGIGGSAGRPLLDRAGNLYSVSTAGGAKGKGIAFQLRRTDAGTWKEKVLYTFKGQPDAGFPYSGLIPDQEGNLYGTTYYDGANNLGSVYKLSREEDGKWKETVLYSFRGGADGDGSIGTLVFDVKGNLYGTTSEGGSAVCGCGTIFKLAPLGLGQWKESVVYRFKGSPQPGFAYNGMAADSGGKLFGATVHGGPTDDGTIYKLVP